MYTSIPNSQSIPPPLPFHTWWLTISSLSKPVSLFVNKFIGIIFLGSAYKWYHIFIYLCPTFFIWYDNLQVYPCYCKWHNFICFNGWVIFHWVYISTTSLSIHLSIDIQVASLFCLMWTKLLWTLGYHVFLWIYAQEWDCWIVWELYF